MFVPHWTLVLLVTSSQLLVATPVFDPDHVHDFDCGQLYYRTFYLDPVKEVLFVGGMDHIYKLSLSNINETSCSDAMSLEATHVSSCVSKGKSQDYDCRNHIRVIQPMSDGRLYVCGTNAHKPIDMVIYSNLTHLNRREHIPGIGDGIAKCPFDPDDNSTAVWVERGNVGDLPGLYSGTTAEFTKADTVIFRPDLYNRSTNRIAYSFKRTVRYDTLLLDNANFVASYDIGEYVYFFFREAAIEYMNCGKNVFSRVGRVCKKDNGGKNILFQNWATFLKARLNCSIPGEFPFYFNEIQGVYKSPNNDGKIYAVFTTHMNGMMGSAVCAFTLDAIQRAFLGKFKEQSTARSAWLPVPSSQVPEPRPGMCVNDTQTLPDTVLNFIRRHPLMDEAVEHENGKPVFYKRDVVFTNLVVDIMRTGTFGRETEYTVYYAGTSDGKVYKVVQWYDRHGESQTQLQDVLEVTTPDPIRRMEISPQHKSLYVSSDHMVRQISLLMCNGRYDSCLHCVRDPYCGWDKDSNTCRPFMPGLLQDVSNSTKGVCENFVQKKKIVVNWGQSIHLGCTVKIAADASTQEITWHHYSKDRGLYRLRYKPEKYVQTADYGLVIITATEADAGRYDCKMGADTICSYNITVDTHRCMAPDKSQDYQKIYSDWCHEFEKYKLAMKTWERKQAQCASKQNLSNQNHHPNEIYQRSTLV